MARDLQPTAGVRFLLEREHDAGATARYRASVWTPSAMFSATATLGDDGTVDLPPTGAAADLDHRLALIARLLARDAAKRRADGLIVWPARLLRWRS